MTFWDIILLWLAAKIFGAGAAGPGPQWPGPKGDIAPEAKDWATPKGPSGPTGPTGPTGPSPTGPTGPTGPAQQTDWKPYFYLQPDSGNPYGTPYTLAAEWHGKGSAWTELYNFTRGRLLSSVGPQTSQAEYDRALSYNWTFPNGLKTKSYSESLPDGAIIRVNISSHGDIWMDDTSQNYLRIAGNIFTPVEVSTTMQAITDKLRASLAAGAPYGSIVAGNVGDSGETPETGSPNYASVGDKLLIPYTWPEPKTKAILDRLQPIPAGTVLPSPSSSGVHGDDATTI